MTAADRRPMDAKARLDATACRTVCRPDAGCDACASACPSKAIAVAARSVEIQADRCSGCGLCAAACPTGALEIPGLPMAETLECARVAPRDRVSGARAVPCLGGLTAAALREGVLAGRLTLVDRGWCATCPLGATAWAHATRVAAEMALLEQPDRLTILPRPTPEGRAGPPPAQEPPPARRRLFMQVVAPPRRTPSALAEKVATPALDARRSALERLAAPGPLPAALFPQLSVPFGSDLGRLAALCPTGAARIEEDETARRLIFDGAACLGCGDCRSVPGVEVRPGAPGTVWPGAQTLAEEPRSTCPRCRMRFGPRPGQRLCDGCEKDGDLAALAHGLMRHRPAAVP
ncbi:ArxB2, iron sulfur cluster subunit (plasmid) [Cereibacter azotoformans]|uniref:DUF362 domain-containing protein n=1 Tax=Cereibacter azotoformans TaxID=43057 RepID=UPI001EEAA4C5|nr:4Fe-4S dicluster domain-containing protein [Cereibacter azotoformans]ULB12472.1 ArxB2, iron sulfur cluster subunit [Cereibacter azotoformans]